MFDPWSPHQSTRREKLMEHVFLGELLRALLRAGRRCEVLRAETDTSGYDLVIEVDGRLRHVQLKTMRSDGKRRNVDLHLGLAAKPAGCVDASRSRELRDRGILLARRPARPASTGTGEQDRPAQQTEWRPKEGGTAGASDCRARTFRAYPDHRSACAAPFRMLGGPLVSTRLCSLRDSRPYPIRCPLSLEFKPKKPGSDQVG